MVNEFQSNPRFALGSICLIVVFVVAITSIFWLPHNPNMMDIEDRFSGFTKEHLLGTDQYGRDELSRILVGARKALMVGLIAVSIGAGFGILFGSIASISNSGLQDLVMRAMDAIYSIPAILLALLITTILGPGIKNSIIAIGIFNIPVFARLSRSSMISIKEEEYIIAAKSSGATNLHIILTHMLPNAASPLIIQGSNSFARALLAEAGLSYLGLGTQPPNASWGIMLKSAQTFAGQAPHLVIVPGLSIVFTVFAFNIFADGLRDMFDPYSSYNYTGE